MQSERFAFAEIERVQKRSGTYRLYDGEGKIIAVGAGRNLHATLFDSLANYPFVSCSIEYIRGPTGWLDIVRLLWRQATAGEA
jgi:hypothetical protein